MSPSGAWREFLRRPSSPPESSPSVGGRRSHRRPASPSARLASSAARRARRGLLAALLLLPLLAALAPDAGAQDQRYSASCADGDARVEEDANGVYVITVREGTSFNCAFDNPSHWANYGAAAQNEAYIKRYSLLNIFFINLPGLTSQTRSNVHIEAAGASRMRIRTPSNQQKHTTTRSTRAHGAAPCSSSCG